METKKEKTFQKWILFTVYNEGSSLAWHLKNEGKDVIVGVVDDLKSVNIKKDEDEEGRKRRLLNYSGILEIKKAETLIAEMEKYENKDEYFIIFDFNSMYEYADKATKMGFTNGLFPTKFDYMLENDRKMAKDFIQQYYPDLKVAPVEEFKTIDEAIEFLDGTEDFYALKGNDISCLTVVPCTKNIKFATEEIIDALRSHKEDYERKGFILECQIRDGIEFCPEMIAYNGVPVSYSVDIENKAIGSGNCSIKAGCAIDMVVCMPPDAEIVPKAFPEAMLKLAKKHKGLFFADVNLILKDGELYYLENCGCRLGFDSIQTQCEMAGGVSKFFESLANGQDPYQSKYGVSVRGFNMHRDDKGESKGELEMRWEEDIEEHIWLFDVYRNEVGKYLNTGYEWELLSVFTGSSDDLEYAIIKAYDVLSQFSFDEIYYRSQGDFMDRNYDGNILSRYDAIEKMISSSEVEEEE